MSEILRIFIAVLILTISLATYFLAITAMFQQRVTKTKTVIETIPGRSFGVGLVNFLFFFVIAFVLLAFAERVQSGVVKWIVTIPALIVIAFLTIILSFGLTAMATFVGEKTFSDVSSWKQVSFGTVILCFASAFPFVGWFLFLPYISFVSIGAFILGVFQREPKVS